jgi:dUTP pyrophosphatase
MDTQTKRIKIATRCQFDEAGMTIPPAQRSRACRALQATDYTGNTPAEEPKLTSMTDSGETEVLQVKLLSPRARLPTRATQEAAGYDVYSPVDCHIEPHSQTTIPLDISVTPPQGTYSQLITRSGHATKHKLAVQAGVIDREFTGNVGVIIYNYGKTPYDVKQGDRIAQLIIIKHATPTCTSVSTLETTARSDNRLGSTGTSKNIISPTIHQVENDTPEIGTSATPNSAPDTVSRKVKEVTSTRNDEDLMPYDIYLSQDPFDQRLEVEIAVKGDHPTLGLMMTQCPQRQQLHLQDMTLSTPGSRIPKWQSTLRNAHLINIEGTPVYTDHDLLMAIQAARDKKKFKIQSTFATDRSYSIHPYQGVPQIYFDQLNIIAHHLQEIQRETNQASIKEATESSKRPEPEPPPNTEPIAQSFKLSQLKKRPDWPEWQQSQYLMLDQYMAQGMFGAPMPLPKNANVFRMLWTYLLKIDGTQKSRMVCDGNPALQRHLTIGHTYTNSLDSASERLFWALVAKEGLIAIEADVSNAFAEAPPPK